MFLPLIKVLKLLESENLLIQSSQGYLKRVSFVLGLVIGDNLELNRILGLLESFFIYFFCRVYKMHKNNT